MSNVSKVNGALQVNCTGLTVSSAGAMTSGVAKLGASDGESSNLWDCDVESSIMMTAGNHQVQGDKLSISGDGGNGILNAYFNTTNSQGELTGNTVVVSYSDCSKNNSIKINSAGSVVQFNNSKYNSVELAQGSNTILMGEGSYGNIAIGGSQDNTFIVNGTHNTLIGTSGTNVFNIEDGADRTFVLGGASGTDTVNDKAGLEKAGGYTFYLARGADVEANLFGNKALLNLMGSDNTNVTFNGRNSYAFKDYTATDNEGVTYDYFNVANKFKWDIEQFTGENGMNLQKEQFNYNIINEYVKDDLTRVTTIPLGYDTLS